MITQNDIVTIHGDRMKYGRADPDEYLRFVSVQNPSQYAEITRCQKITDREIVFLMPSVSFPSGYFEIGTKRGTCTLRTGKSLPVAIAQTDGGVPPGSWKRLLFPNKVFHHMAEGMPPRLFSQNK